MKGSNLCVTYTDEYRKGKGGQQQMREHESGQKDTQQHTPPILSAAAMETHTYTPTDYTSGTHTVKLSVTGMAWSSTQPRRPASLSFLSIMATVKGVA